MGRFVTLLVVVIDPATHEARVVNAGHPLPLLRRADGTVAEVGAGVRGTALGVVPGRTYQECRVPLATAESLTPYNTAGADPAARSLRASFLPRESRGWASIVISLRIVLVPSSSKPF